MLALNISALRKVYPNGVEALKGIDFAVAEGDFYALLGPNGAGKTTTIGIITSLVSKSSGTVEVFGHSIDSELEAAKQCIGLVPQEINLNQFDKVLNTVLYQAGYYGIPRRLAMQRAEKYLTQLKLWDRRNDISRNLSGGMKRRLMIARALVHEPRLLILDEPTAGVDIEIRRSMWRFLREINAAGTTIILTTHYLEEAESLCRNIAIIDEGRIIENNSMGAVLRKLQREVFVLTPSEPVGRDFALDGFESHVRDDGDIEVVVDEGRCLNDLFASVGAVNIRIESMRNKANRLEELFIGLVEDKQGAAGAGA